MKRKKVALYDPYLDVLGGGEKHILSILKVLEEKEAEINIFWDKNLSAEFHDIFGFTFKRINFLPNIFNIKGVLKKITILNKFDYFFYVPDGSYFFSSAKTNFIFCMVPKQQLYPQTFINRTKTFNYKFISNSYFTQKWLASWGIKSQVIYPFVDKRFINLDLNKIKKNKIILSVGRFFKHLHAKKQDFIINLFKKIKQKCPFFKKFKLILVGGLKKEDREYYRHLKSLINNDQSIELLANLSSNQLIELFKKAVIYWHFTGYGIDENQNPEKVEHLGISPLEAMASGCITFCYNAGGPKEIIKDDKNGFLFSDDKELFNKMSLIINNPKKQKIIITKAKQYIKDNFDYEVFKKRVETVLKL